MPGESSPAADGIDRRTVLKGLSAVPISAMVAGCGSGGDGDGGTPTDGSDGDGGSTPGDGGGDGDGDGDGGTELGERVPTLTLEYLGAQAGRTAIMEEMSPFVAEDLAAIGVDIEIQSKPVAQSVAEIIDDARNAHLWMAISTSSPDRLDPQEWMLRLSINNAGAGAFNLANYANCEFSGPALEQQRVNPTRRRELVTEALNIAADDYAMLPITGELDFSVVHTDKVDVRGTGAGGFRPVNPMSMIRSRPTGGNEFRISANAAALARKNWTVIQQGPTFFFWNAHVYSPLIMYDEDFNLVNSLAADYTINDDATQYTVELDDATFHNGDPITAEHVKFTFEFVSGNSDAVYKAIELPIDSIDAVDDKTVEFNWTEPYPVFLERDMPLFGILHKDQWGPADGNSGDFNLPDDIIGSGPFQVASFQNDQSARLTPHDGHPNFQPDHDIVFVAFRDQQSAAQAYEAGEIDVITLLSPSGYDRLRGQGDSQGFTSLGVVPGPGIYPQFPMSPPKFHEFRNAIGKAVDRERINQVVLFGEGNPQTHPIWFLSEHPWHPDNIDGTPDLSTTYVDDPSGDKDAARQVLADAGWGWDDDGRLHYPPGADTSPLWPANSVPGQDEFPCVDEEGNYAG